MANLCEIPQDKLSQFIDRLAYAGMTLEQAFAVLKDPSIATRMVAAAVVWKIMVDYSKSLKVLISAGSFNHDRVDELITAHNFPAAEKSMAEVELQYVRFDEIVSTAEALAEIEKRNLRPANLHELIVFGTINPKEQEKFGIMSLIPWVIGEDEFVVSPGLSEGRRLGLWVNEEGGWRSDWRFLAARKAG